MPLLITEFAVQADGSFAIELTNTGATSLDITDYTIHIRNAANGAGSNLDISGSFGAPSTLTAGQSIVLGITGVPGVQYSEAGLDSFVSFFQPVDLVYIADDGTIIDHIGQETGSGLGSDASFQSDATRTPDSDILTENQGAFSSGTFSDNSLGSVACFLVGTLIATPSGEVPVQDLRIGDTVLTADGRTTTVLWLGEQGLRPRIGTLPEQMQPVCISAGALGNGLPLRDLLLTADHAVMLDGYAVNAAALVGCDGIDWMPVRDAFTVYHVETAAHDVILANGAPAETFMDAAGRGAFDNHQEYLDLYGVERIIPEMPRPRINAQRLLPNAIKARLGIDRTAPLLDIAANT